MIVYRINLCRHMFKAALHSSLKRLEHYKQRLAYDSLLLLSAVVWLPDSAKCLWVLDSAV